MSRIPVEMFIPVTPWKTTAQQKRIDTRTTETFVSSGRSPRVFGGGKAPKFFHNREYVAAETELVMRLKTFPKFPSLMQGPLKVSLTLVWPYLASVPKKISQQETMLPHHRRPDLDNLSKLYTDALALAGHIKDDGQIADLHLLKYWGPDSAVGIRYKIYTL